LAKIRQAASEAQKECAASRSPLLVSAERESLTRREVRRMCDPLGAPLNVMGLDLKLMSSLCRNEIFIAMRQLLV